MTTSTRSTQSKTFHFSVTKKASVGTCITTIFRVAWEPPRVDESGRAIADRETKPIALLSDAIGSILEQLKVTASPDLHDCTMSSAAEMGNENGSESTDVKPLKLAFLNCMAMVFMQGVGMTLWSCVGIAFMGCAGGAFENCGGMAFMGSKGVAYTSGVGHGLLGLCGHCLPEPLRP